MTGRIIEDGHVKPIARVYDPATNSCTSAAFDPTSALAPTLLSDGKVLFASTPSSFLMLYDPKTNTSSPAASPRDTLCGKSTLLQTGQLLVAGGRCGMGPALSSAELYDPATNSWSPTGSMAAPREGHKVQLLRDGRVLVLGGVNDSGFVSSAEVYDPVTKAWSPAGRMITSRDPWFQNYSVSLVGNGKVLVVGGVVDGSPTASTELYDPAANKWSAASSLNYARAEATTSALPDGKVLVLGGMGTTSVALASAELYDSVTDKWNLVAGLVDTRFDHSAILLGNGKVLVWGGRGPAGAPRSLELYDPGTEAAVTATAPAGPNSWTSAAKMTTARSGHSAVLLQNGRVLVVGGWGFPIPSPSIVPLSSAELFDPNSNTWSAAGSVSANRGGTFTTTLLSNGNVLLAGGSDISGRAGAGVQLYQPGTNMWSTAADMSPPRSRPSATLLANGLVLITGGVDASGSPLASTALYDPKTNSWSAGPSMATARFGHEAIRLTDGKVLVIGGTGYPSGTSSAEVYDPNSGRWSPAGVLTSRVNFTATRLANGTVLVAGGWNYQGNQSQLLATTDVFDPARNTWSAAADMTIARADHSATLLRNGQVLVVGGPSWGTATAELYDPIAKTWSEAPPISTARQDHTATLLNDGRVLVAGGSFYDSLSSAELYNSNVPATSAAALHNVGLAAGVLGLVGVGSITLVVLRIRNRRRSGSGSR